MLLSVEQIKKLNTLMGDESNIGAIFQVRSEKSISTHGLGALAEQEGVLAAAFPLYSIAKSILSVFTLKLAEAQKFKLDDPFSKYMSRDLPEWLQEASIRHLLSHRSGLADYGPLKIYRDAVISTPQQKPDKERFVQAVLEAGPQFQLGESFSYSNVGYLFLREILESITGLNMQEMFEKFIAESLDIKMDFLQGTGSKVMSGSSPYLGVADIRGVYNFDWVLHGTFSSTISDVTKLFFEIENVLSAESLTQMTGLYPLDFPYPYLKPSYGLGLMGDMQSKYGPVYGHNGGGPGFSTAVYRVTKQNLTVAAVVNGDSKVEADRIVFEFLEMVQSSL